MTTMRKPEQQLWEDVRTVMGGYWSATRIENTVADGLPDVEWSGARKSGWLELKVVERARWGEPLVISHLRAAQVNWFHTKATRGDGRADLLVRINHLTLEPKRKIQAHILVPAWLVRSLDDRSYCVGTMRMAASLDMGPLNRDWLWSSLRTGDRYERVVD